jgi:chromosome segregation ATPase
MSDQLDEIRGLAEQAYANMREMGDWVGTEEMVDAALDVYATAYANVLTQLDELRAENKREGNLAKQCEDNWHAAEDEIGQLRAENERLKEVRDGGITLIKLGEERVSEVEEENARLAARVQELEKVLGPVVKKAEDEFDYLFGNLYDTISRAMEVKVTITKMWYEEAKAQLEAAAQAAQEGV